MSTDHDFEHELTARMGAAADPVTGAGVTLVGVESRLAQRRAGRRRRQGALALVAAAAVVLGGVGLAAAVGDGGGAERTGPASEGDPSSTEAPTTYDCLVGEAATTVPPDVVGTGPAPGPADPCAPSTTVCEVVPPTTVTLPEVTAEEPEDGSGHLVCAPVDPSTTTTRVPSDGPETTGSPTPATDAPTTSPASTTTPAGQACAPGPADPDCVDPEGDGTYTHLIGGADCMASPIGGPSCADLDGDGHAGYPDQG